MNKTIKLSLLIIIAAFILAKPVSVYADTIDLTGGLYGRGTESNPLVYSITGIGNYESSNLFKGYYRFETAGDETYIVDIKGAYTIYNSETDTTKIEFPQSVTKDSPLTFYVAESDVNNGSVAINTEESLAKAEAAAALLSTDINNPAILESGKTYTLPPRTGASADYYYFTFTLPADSMIKVSGNPTYGFRYEQKEYINDTNAFNEYIEDEQPVAFAAGSWVFRLLNMDYSNSKDISITITPIELGTITVTGLSERYTSGSTIKAHIKLTGADPNITLSGWGIRVGDINVNLMENNTNIDSIYRKLEADISADIGDYTPIGNAVLWVTATHSGGAPKGSTKITGTTGEFKFDIAPLPLTYTVTSSYKSITFKTGFGGTSGDYADYQIYENGNWVTKQTAKIDKPVTISGLKDHTNYKVRVVSFKEKTATSDRVYAEPSKETSLTTGYKTAPAIKSISIKRGKVQYIKRQWHPGKYVGSTWFKGYYTGGYYSSNYTIKVTLKKNIKGIAGLRINGEKVKGKGKTFKLNASRKGKNIKGIKIPVTVESYLSNSYGGYSKAVVKKAKIK